MSNKNTWEQEDIVEYYTPLTALQPPEVTITNILRDRLSGMRMLDIGVGAGRTALYFAELVKEYVGIDYSERMISRCKDRFAATLGNITFQVCDARSMDVFADNQFDLILFSFNGLDNLPHHERLLALKEINRIGRPGGYFCFSTHNLQYINQLGIRKQLSWTPRTTLKRINQWVLLIGQKLLDNIQASNGQSTEQTAKSGYGLFKLLWRFARLSFVYNNPIQVLKLIISNYAFINDGAHGYRLKQYYITPSEQLKQLNGYFENVRLFLNDGGEVSNGAEIKTIDDWWIYYLCNFTQKHS